MARGSFRVLFWLAPKVYPKSEPRTSLIHYSRLIRMGCSRIIVDENAPFAGNLVIMNSSKMQIIPEATLELPKADITVFLDSYSVSPDRKKLAFFERQITAGGVTYTLRYYPPPADNYAGVGNDGIVYGLGSFTGGQIKSFGTLASYTCVVDPELCVPALASVIAERYGVTGFPLGAAIGPASTTASPDVGLLRKHFSSITAENVMKPHVLWPNATGSSTTPAAAPSFAQADTLAQFAAANGMRLRGHTLLWHQSAPSGSSPATSATRRAQSEETPDARILLCTAEGLKWVSVSALSQDSTSHEPLQNNLKPFCPFCLLGGSALMATATGLALPLPSLLGFDDQKPRDTALLAAAYDMAWPFSQGPPA